MKLPFSRSALVRAVPFVVFMALLALRGLAPEDSSWGFDTRWLYAAKVVVVGAMLTWWWREYGELSHQTWPTARELSWAVAVGALVSMLTVTLRAGWQGNKRLGLRVSVIASTLAGLMVCGMFQDLVQWRLMWIVPSIFVAMWIQDRRPLAATTASGGARRSRRSRA